jgi:aldehyde dehydrogenase (NAD(P)+)
MSPVNAYWGPLFEKAFEPLVADGYPRFVYGGGGGAYLCAHPSINTIRIAGGEYTHDLIVYVGGDEGAATSAHRWPEWSAPRRTG